MSSTRVLCLTIALAFLLPGCLGSDDRCATYGASQSVDFYAVGDGASGLIDASYSTDGENKTWNCCDVDVVYDDGVIGPVSWSIVGYIFAKWNIPNGKRGKQHSMFPSMTVNTTRRITHPDPILSFVASVSLEHSHGRRIKGCSPMRTPRIGGSLWRTR